MGRCPVCGYEGDVIADLFSGAGGAGMGYHRARWHPCGIDNRPQPRYPFCFIQADAMTYPLEWASAIHASPPCQDHIRGGLESLQQDHGTGWMLDAIRTRLQASGKAWVIENVPGAPMRSDYKLCGCQFDDLWRLGRARLFETSWHGFDLRPPCHHPEPLIECYGGGGRSVGARPGIRKAKGTVAERRRAMGIDWMTRDEINQAIPPAYTEYIGAQLLEQISEPQAAAQESLL